MYGMSLQSRVKAHQVVVYWKYKAMEVAREKVGSVKASMSRAG